MYLCTYICTSVLTYQEVLRVQEKERRRRLPPGTLVIGTCQFVGEEDGVSISLLFIPERCCLTLVESGKYTYVLQPFQVCDYTHEPISAAKRRQGASDYGEQ